MALTDPSILGDLKNLDIRVKINTNENYISVRDTGIGMTKQELIDNLGTIAKSGTIKFL
jgi:heat shock protein beta